MQKFWKKRKKYFQATFNCIQAQGAVYQLQTFNFSFGLLFQFELREPACTGTRPMRKLTKLLNSGK